MNVYVCVERDSAHAMCECVSVCLRERESTMNGRARYKMIPSQVYALCGPSPCQAFLQQLVYNFAETLPA
jgi:hypothetical protein